MKHQYESELIKEIVDARGHKKSSLHYESECMETWIEGAKGGYPKLCDYESEWLKYISILYDTGGSEDPEPPIGEFPYVVLSDVTEATIDNVVPYAYKSAILKGNTILVNEENNEEKIEYEPFTLERGYFNLQTTDGVLTEITDDNFADSTTSWYTPVFNRCSAVMTFQSDAWNGFRIVYYDNEKKPLYFLRKNDNPSNVLTLSSPLNAIYFRISTYTDKTIRCVSNKDYLKLHSVKMPVLTTSNEDGTKTNILSTPSDLELRGIGDVKDMVNCLTGEVVENTIKLTFSGIEKWETSTNLTNYMTFRLAKPSNMITADSHSSASKYMCDKLQIVSNTVGSTEIEAIWFSSGHMYIRLPKTKASSLEEFKTYLSTNNIQVVSCANNPIIKTVDLNIQDQNGKTLSVIKPIEGKMFLSTSSDTIKPLFSGEIPVEAITQNLASFIDLD